MTEDDRIAAVAAVIAWLWGELADRWWSLRWASLQDDFAGALPDMLDMVARAQTEAAGFGAQFANDQVGGRVGVQPDSLAGVASDGRSLAGLLVVPMVQAFTAASRGAPSAIAQDLGAESLDRIVSTQVEDAARAGEQVAMGGNREVRGYLRLTEPKACGRCIILAGRFYRWNEGFARHPKCRCTHKPITGGWTDADQDPKQLFEALSPAEQTRAFTKAGAEAIRLGADPAKVINARRGMNTATSTSGRKVLTRREVFGKQVFTTAESTGRSRAQQRKAPVRLMPESILELATDRADAIRLLRVHRYIN